MPETTTVTVLFTDVVGSTSMRQRQGDTAGHQIMSAHNDIVRREIQQHAGREVKTIGDSFMVAFDSARRAVECAIAVQRSLHERNRSTSEEPVLVRIGLHTGEAIREGDDLFGTSVDAAARVMSRAEGEQILVSEVVKAVLGAAKDIDFADRGRFRLKGFPERWHLWQVVWQTEERPVEAAPAERTPFVGRFDEREALRRLLERAQSGRGGVALVGGEAGVGKTRLTDEIATEARARGLFVVHGHCYEMEGAPPYIPFVEAIEYGLRVTPRDLFRTAMGEAAPEIARLVPKVAVAFPDLPPAIDLPPEQAQHYMFESVCDFFERAATAIPLLIVLEDLHWADESSAQLLERVARRAEAAPLLVIGTYRDTDLGPSAPFMRAIERLSRVPSVTRITLKRMARAEVGQIIRGLSGRTPPEGLVDVLFRETDGVPFFVEEVYRHLAEERRLLDEAGNWLPDVAVGEVEVPETVRVVLGRRIDRVSESAQRIITVAAAIGHAFPYRFLATLVDEPEDALFDALDEAERARLVVATEGPDPSFTFAHEQIRQTLLGRLSSLRRQRLHVRIADAIEAFYPRDLDDHVSDLAYHLSQGGARERAAAYLVRAAGHAAARLATTEALQQYGRAISLAEPGATRRLALRHRGRLLLALFRGAEAVADFQEAVRLAREDSAPAEELEGLLGLAPSHYVVSLDHGPSNVAHRETAERARALAVDLGDRANEARALIAGHWLASNDPGGRPAVVANVQRAVAIAGELHDETLDLEVRRAAFQFLTLAEREAESDTLGDILERRRELMALNEHLFGAMWVFLARARLQRCVDCCDRAVALAATLGIPPVQYATIRALALMDMGRFGDARDSLGQEVSDEAHPFGRAFQRWGRATWYLHTGDFVAAADAARATIPEARSLGRAWMEPAMNSAIALAAIGLRRRAGEPVDLDAVKREVESAGGHLEGEALAEALLASGDAEGALRETTARAAANEESGATLAWLVAAEHRARALLALGRDNDAASAAAEALALTAERGVGRLTWRLRASNATALDRLGSPDAAAERQAAARDLMAVAATIPDPAARANFLAQREAAQLLA